MVAPCLPGLTGPGLGREVAPPPANFGMVDASPLLLSSPPTSAAPSPQQMESATPVSSSHRAMGEIRHRHRWSWPPPSATSICNLQTKVDFESPLGFYWYNDDGCASVSDAIPHSGQQEQAFEMVTDFIAVQFCLLQPASEQPWALKKNGWDNM